MGSAQLQIAPRSSLHFSISAGPFRCSGCRLQGFNLLHWSLLKRFPLFGFCLQGSSVPIFRPHTGGRRWTHSGCWFRRAAGRAWRCFPVCSAQAPGGSLWSVPCAARFQPSGVPQKPGTKSCACVLCLPHQSGSGSPELEGRTLPRAARLLPSGVLASVSARPGRVPVPCVSPRPSW